ncbi:MAG TPA: hypothetical protein VGG99_09930 [Acetobacteraceae bacterium]|jgi:hypothetical protein
MSDLDDHHNHIAATESVQRTVSWADTLWTVIGLLGLKEIVLAALVATAVWVGGRIRGEPVVSLSASAFALFIVLTFLSKVLVFASAISTRPRAGVWRHVQDLTLGEAACLLANVSPVGTMGSGIFPTPNALAFYRVLAEAVYRGNLERSPEPPSGNPGLPPDQINMGTFVTRASLKKFAAQRGFKARFLR